MATFRLRGDLEKFLKKKFPECDDVVFWFEREKILIVKSVDTKKKTSKKFRVLQEFDMESILIKKETYVRLKVDFQTMLNLGINLNRQDYNDDDFDPED